MTNIETGARTLFDLATWIMAQPPEIQSIRIYTFHPDFLEDPWHGVIELTDQQRIDLEEGRFEIREARAVISDSWTQEEFNRARQERDQREQQTRKIHWSRPEVLDAQRRGLLP